MKNKHFWRWVENNEDGEELESRMLYLDGAIAEESWFDDDITPEIFRDELSGGTGPITVLINSPGGDVIAAAQIYNMLSQYPAKVTVMIDGLAASAASVIAMAGDEVKMSPVSMLMIHNPAMMAYGDHKDFEHALDVLAEFKESIINAYVEKTGLSRNKVSRLMDDETWMNARTAMELGFADSIEGRFPTEPVDNFEPFPVKNVMFSRKSGERAFLNKLEKALEPPKEETPDVPKDETEPNTVPQGRSVSDIMERLSIIKKFI